MGGGLWLIMWKMRRPEGVRSFLSLVRKSSVRKEGGGEGSPSRPLISNIMISYLFFSSSDFLETNLKASSWTCLKVSDSLT